MRQKASADQRRLAKILGVDVSRDSRAVAAARLQDAVARPLNMEPSRSASARQIAFGRSLGLDVSTDSLRVASARIGDMLDARNQEALQRLRLKPGDAVVRVAAFEYEGQQRVLREEFVVSSIQENGRVFFKGGNGQGAWPTELERLSKSKWRAVQQADAADKGR